MGQALRFTCHGSTVRYQVAALVIYRHAEGHYVAFIHSDSIWYLANDMVYRTSTPPTEYPYILVLVKDEAAAARVMPRLHGQGVESLGLQPSALSTLLQKRVHLQRETYMPVAGGVEQQQAIADPAPVTKKRKQCKAMQNRKRCQAYTASARSEYCRACCTNLRRRNIVHRASEMERASLAGIFKPLRARGNAPLKR